MTITWTNWQILILATVGIGGFLLGLSGAVVHSSRRQTRGGYYSAALVLLALAGVGGVARLTGQPGFVWLPPFVLMAAFLAFWFTLTHPSIERLFQFVQFMRVNSLRTLFWILFMAGSLLFGIQHALSDEDELETSNSLEHHYSKSLPSLRLVEQTGVTDRGRTIQLSIAVSEPDGISDAEILTRQKKILTQFGLNENVIALGINNRVCNCFGLVFTGGKFWIDRNAVEQILEDNGYRVIEKPKPGDLVLYRNGNGVVDHAGIVRVVEKDGTVIVESKWGLWGRFLHRHDVHLWSGIPHTYQRSSRKGGHVLKGLN